MAIHLGWTILLLLAVKQSFSSGTTTTNRLLLFRFMTFPSFLYSWSILDNRVVLLSKLPRSPALRASHPVIVENILNAIGQVTESAHQLITAPNFDPTSHASLKHLGELVTVNHGLLVSLGVSHPKLERIREIIDHTGIGWTKLTGAGGGGCAITILKPQPPAFTNGHGNGHGAHNPESDDSDSSSEAELDCSASIISNGTKQKYKILDSLENQA